MKNRINNLVEKLRIKKHPGIYIFLIVMAVVYGIDMFMNKPWYDELYTYYYFVSRGPIYAAIHWPVPNNHVGYSVLSACFDIFGNSYIGLRAVSVLAALTNIVLLYYFCTQFMNKTFSFATVVLYNTCYLVYSLAFQGRGYTLGVTCYLVTLICLYRICLAVAKRRDYVLFPIAMIVGLYVLPSSLYWVIPTCVTGGIYMLCKRRYADLRNIVLLGLLAAVCVFGLYSIIWLAIGSNLLCKDVSGAFYGMSHVSVILSAPVKAFKTGLDYMLATPYIQSIPRADAIMGLPEYFKELFDQYIFYSGIALCLCLVVLIALGCAYSYIWMYGMKSRLFAALYIAVTCLMVPLMLIIQSVHPYKRVFSFFAIPLFMGIMIALYLVFEQIDSEKYKHRAEVAVLCIVLFLFIASILSPTFRAPIAGRENDIEEVLKTINVNDIDSIYYTDDFQKYVLKFYHDVEPVETDLETADYVMLASEYNDDSYLTADWPIIPLPNEDALQYIFENFTQIASTDKYSVWCRGGQ